MFFGSPLNGVPDPPQFELTVHSVNNGNEPIIGIEAELIHELDYYSRPGRSGCFTPIKSIEFIIFINSIGASKHEKHTYWSADLKVHLPPSEERTDIFVVNFR